MPCSKLRPLFLILTLLLTTNTSACGVLDWMIGENIDVNGSRATISQERGWVGNSLEGYILFGSKNQFRRVDIVALLTGGQTCAPESSFDDSERQERCVEWAFYCFDYYAPGQCQPLPKDGLTPTPGATPDPEDQRRRRNAVQERLIAASNSGCREFTQHLNTYQSYTNLALGTAAVGTGAAGAIVSTATSARALAGVTGALAGTRAEYNADLFAKQLVATIVQAINKSRGEYLVTLRGSKVEGAAQPQPTQSPAPSPSPAPSSTPMPVPDRGKKRAASKKKGKAGPDIAPPKETSATVTMIPGKQSLSIAEYSVEAAIADAINYNDLCSLDNGLQTLTESLSAAGNPGLDEFYSEVQKYNKIKDALGPTAAPSPGPPAKPGKPAKPGGGNDQGSSLTKVSILKSCDRSHNRVARLIVVLVNHSPARIGLHSCGRSRVSRLTSASNSEVEMVPFVLVKSTDPPLCAAEIDVIFRNALQFLDIILARIVEFSSRALECLGLKPEIVVVRFHQGAFRLGCRCT